MLTGKRTQNSKLKTRNSSLLRFLGAAFLAMLFCVFGFAADERSLDSGWEFRETGTESWMPASVPGTVHTDLLNNKKIEDPFYRDNEKSLQWISKRDWEYRLVFNAPQADSKGERKELVFEGLDTYADVFLNSKKILSADNMFRTWRVEVGTLLRERANELVIKFRSPINEVLPRMAALDYELPASNDQGEKTSPYTRKAPYQFGWDWGPRFVTSGIWRNVRLVSWEKARILDLNIIQDDVSKRKARITASVEIEVEAGADASVVLNDAKTGKRLASKGLGLVEGRNNVEFEIEIDNPRLWYPVGFGDQEMYEFSAEVSIGDRSTDAFSRRTGLRTLELRQKPDNYGTSFEFVVNGIPVFARGANWIPADVFPTRVTREKYRTLLTSLRDANMNMIRVWGGGIYEDDAFYELADELGLLVWQDFMFACSMYPGDKDFLENVRAEAIDNIKRLRNHPSIALWVGNNEIETAWLHWDWKENNPSHMWDDYQKLFNRLLPEIVEEFDPGRTYWPSSPSSNYQADPESERIGDMHYWQVWHGGKPFEEYTKVFPRFMSEYGFQSFPELETVASFTTPEDRKGIETPVMLAHQKHPRGNQLIRTYMEREFPQPKDFESFLYASQVLQAEGIKLGTEHFRRIMPRNMGTLYWQANDCWPVASWSAMDYFGRWKALMYYTKRFYSPVLVSPYVDQRGQLKIDVVNDTNENVHAKIIVNVFHVDGRRLNSIELDAEVSKLSSTTRLERSLAELLAGFDKTDVVISAEIVSDDRVISMNRLILVPYKEVRAKRPSIDFNITSDAEGFLVEMTADRPSFAVKLESTIEGRFVDNFLDLMPGRKTKIRFIPRNPTSQEDFKKSLQIVSLADAFS
ncbi:MAG: glycoside hydrolase family 2 protein [Pyrinomonadaceae bacterium]